VSVVRREGAADVICELDEIVEALVQDLMLCADASPRASEPKR